MKFVQRTILIFAIFVLIGINANFSHRTGGADQPDFPNIYIDEGCAGTHVGSQANPYDDLSDVNWTTGGDNSVYDAIQGGRAVNIHLNKGDAWTEQLSPGCDGTATYRITIKSYGTGNDPIINAVEDIAGWTTGGNWTDETGNIWSIACDPDPLRLFLDGTEYFESDAQGNIDNTERWYWASDVLYVYATENPSTMYSSMQGAYVSINYPIYPNQKNYITFQDLDVRGGKVAIYLYACNYCVVDSCTAGQYSGDGGICNTGRPATPWQTCTYNEIKNCTVDLDYHNSAMTHVTRSSMDGISLIYGSQNCSVHDCTVVDANHTGIAISCTNANFRTTGNEVYDNDISAPNSNYMRGIDFSTNVATDDACDRNKVYRNYIHDTTVRNQIHGNHNELCYNIIDTVTEGNGDGGADLANAISMFAGFGQKCHDNKIYNNVIYNTDHHGIKIYGYGGCGDKEDNYFRNNIIMNWGAGEYGIYIDNDSTTLVNTYENNELYKSGVSDVVYYKTEADTIAEFNAETYDTTADNISSDPKFINPATPDFHLQSISPCLNAGIDVGLTSDYEGNTIPRNGTLNTNGLFRYVSGALYMFIGSIAEGIEDIGAYEYISTYKFKDGHLYLRLSDRFYLRIN